MNELLTIIGNVGFPIAISAYLLIRLEGKLVDLTAVIGELREAILVLPAAPAWNSSLAYNLSSTSPKEVVSPSQIYPPT
ncbi:MAG: YvrJ family protein [Syntrophomonas sp.]|nr:YvrJ family protein [Syntrophomonas sp.]